MVLKVTSLSFLVLGLVQSAVLPVEKCSLGESTCLTPAFNTMLPVFTAGIPDANVEVLDPLEMDDLSFDLAGLQFSLKEGRVKGLKGAVINNVDWDTKKKIFTTDFSMENVSVKGHYTAGGRILILPITGDGQMKMKLKNVQIKLYIHYDIVKGDDGKDRVKPKKYTFDFDIKDNAHFHLTGLFNGNKELSDTMLAFLNENWKQISVEFGRPMIDGVAKKMYKNIGNFFEAMPIEEIANV